MTTPTRTIPEGLDLISSTHELTIRRVWLSWKIVPLAGFTIIWDLFIGYFYTQALAAKDVSWIAIVFPLGHLAVGVWLTYFVIASLVNRTDVVLSPSGVRIAIGPAPWAGNKEINVEDIAAVVVRERRGSKGFVSYSVMYADRARKERKLLAGLPERDQADYIAAMIRETLGLAAEAE